MHRDTDNNGSVEPCRKICHMVQAQFMPELGLHHSPLFYDRARPIKMTHYAQFMPELGLHTQPIVL